jgi:hypothetical protein
MLAICLSYLAFVMLRNIPSIYSFFSAFIMKNCWNLSKTFSATIEIIMWFYSLLLFICCIAFIDLCLLNHPCTPGMNPTCYGVLSFWCIVELGLPNRHDRYLQSIFSNHHAICILFSSSWNFL